MQFLEGPRSRVRACYHRIAKDPRHRGIVEIYRALSGSDEAEEGPRDGSAAAPRLKGKGKRDFGEWSMAYRPVATTPVKESANGFDNTAAVEAARVRSADRQRAVAVAASGASTQEEVEKAEDSFSELLMYSNRKVE